MSEYKTKPLDILVVFFIGFTAGVSPFLFMQVLPSLLNPELTFLSTNWAPIVITGILIGVISTIIFSPDFKKKQPQEIFFHALGIPAVLIASVSNLSTQFEAQTEISAAKDNASTSILLQPKEEEIDLIEEITLIFPRHDKPKGFKIFSEAHADNGVDSSDNELPNSRYIVTVGEYKTEEKAKEQYEIINKRKLSVEKYLPKRLKIYRISNTRHVISYAEYSDQSEARKAYKLLRINDPSLQVNILHFR